MGRYLYILEHNADGTWRLSEDYRSPFYLRERKGEEFWVIDGYFDSVRGNIAQVLSPRDWLNGSFPVSLEIDLSCNLKDTPLIMKHTMRVNCKEESISSYPKLGPILNDLIQLNEYNRENFEIDKEFNIDGIRLILRDGETEINCRDMPLSKLLDQLHLNTYTQKVFDRYYKDTLQREIFACSGQVFPSRPIEHDIVIVPIGNAVYLLQQYEYDQLKRIQDYQIELYRGPYVEKYPLHTREGYHFLELLRDCYMLPFKMMMDHLFFQETCSYLIRYKTYSGKEFEIPCSGIYQGYHRNIFNEVITSLERS